MDAMRTLLLQSDVYEGLPIEFLLEGLLLTLTNNYFRFEKNFYIQEMGTAMGSAIAPTYANSFMYAYESRHILSTYKEHLIQYHRFVDDIFILWQGTAIELEKMIEELNNLNSTIKFTLTYSPDKIQFLDVEIFRKDRNIGHRLFRKPSDRNTLLHANSAHPKALKESLPISQYLRVYRNNSEESTCKTQLEDMTRSFVERGYTYKVLQECQIKAENIYRGISTKQLQNLPRITIPLSYHTESQRFSHRIKGRWDILSSDRTLNPFFLQKPRVAYSRN
ncbi:Hypothetical predicted protein [Pelobates cultripes]|uniref:Reverse transcriptase domain-containing protein n=2 Tax=Pelobates cultripes TaxID=61616 RepID=A0AAD1W3V9_PELCU|nr:Hypothetical predicted protein [Pelobates cultripes]